MKRLLLLAVLAGLFGLAISGLQAAKQPASGSCGCCTSPANCPTPSSCAH